VSDFQWFTAGGEAVRPDDLNDSPPQPLQATAGGAFLILFNPTGETTSFTVPADAVQRSWTVVIDISSDDPLPSASVQGPVTVAAHAMLVLSGS
jgi:pullulanase/glycogen debranching enzyme